MGPATSSCPPQPVDISWGAGKGGEATHTESILDHQEQSWISGSASRYFGPTSQPFATCVGCGGGRSCITCGSSATEGNSSSLQAIAVDGDSAAGCFGNEAQPSGSPPLLLHHHPPSFAPFRMCMSISCDGHEAGGSSPAHAGTALGSSSAPTRPPPPWSPSAPGPLGGPSPAAAEPRDANGPAADLMDLDGRCPPESGGVAPGLWAGAGSAGDGCLQLREDSLDMEGVASLPEELTKSLELSMMRSLADCEEQGQQQQPVCSAYGLGDHLTGSIDAEHMADGFPFAVVTSGGGAASGSGRDGPNSVGSTAPTSDSLTGSGAKEPATHQCSSVPGGSSGPAGGGGGGGGSGGGGGGGGSGATRSTARGRRQQASASWAQGDSGQESEGSDDARGGTAAAVRPDGPLKVRRLYQHT